MADNLQEIETNATLERMRLRLDHADEQSKQLAEVLNENAALRFVLQEAINGMGGAYAVWSEKAREVLRGKNNHAWIPTSERLPSEDEVVVVLLRSGDILTAWATYWHGSSNAFAHWTFPHEEDAEATEDVTHWLQLPPTHNAEVMGDGPASPARRPAP